VSVATSATLHTPAELLALCEGDNNLVDELIALFRADTPYLLQMIHQAANNNDAAGVAAAAHKLLSSLGTFGATNACAMVRALEEQGRKADLAGVHERISMLEQEIDLIQSSLSRCFNTAEPDLNPLLRNRPRLNEPALADA
jgi:HPt (histidine-containing phosphotransfer) domain-containing protein